MDSLRAKLLAFGLPGLFVIAFLDSAGIPLPGGVDLVVMLLSWQRPESFFYVAALAAIGSVLGCLVLYRIARTGGEAMMARFTEDRQRWVKEKVRQNDVLAVVVAMLGPPPFPTKLFILVAGIVQMDWRRFAAAVLVGRLIRFLGLAYLAMRVGDRAADTLKENYPTVGIILVTVVALYVLFRHFASKRQTA